MNHFANSVSIGPEFFSKVKNDYSSFEWAIAREFLQNSIDCNSSIITVKVEDYGTDTRVIVTNDGDPMTREILLDKLLALGSSGKDFKGTIGGYGRAKEVLYFCHKQYHIESGSSLVVGSGARYNYYNCEGLVDERHGTSSTIVVDGNRTEKIISAFKRFCSTAQWGGTITLNGENLPCNLKKGSPRRQMGFGKVYTNKSFPNKLIVRISGIPMFQSWISFDRCVIVELEGTSAEVLTSNRDGLVSKYRYELDEFISELATDKRKALKSSQPRYKHIEGVKLRHRTQKNLNVRNLVEKALAPMPVSSAAFVPPSQPMFKPKLGIESGSVGVYDRSPTTPSVYSLAPRPTINEEFIIRNETDLKIPEYYMPDSDQFCTYAKKLAQIWGRLMVQLHRLFEHEAEFAIGFGFDEESEASFEDGNYGKVYYLNPATVVKQENSESKSFKKRFKLTERNRLLMIAVHEFTHGIGNSGHNEEFACQLTDATWVVMDHRKDFNWCFNG